MNRWVLRCFLKVTVFVSSCSDGGKLFQATGPAKLAHKMITNPHIGYAGNHTIDEEHRTVLLLH